MLRHRCSTRPRPHLRPLRSPSSRLPSAVGLRESFLLPISGAVAFPPSLSPHPRALSTCLPLQVSLPPLSPRTARVVSSCRRAFKGSICLTALPHTTRIMHNRTPLDSIRHYHKHPDTNAHYRTLPHKTVRFLPLRAPSSLRSSYVTPQPLSYLSCS